MALLKESPPPVFRRETVLYLRRFCVCRGSQCNRALRGPPGGLWHLLRYLQRRRKIPPRRERLLLNNVQPRKLHASLSSLLHASDLCGNRPRLEGRRNRACFACARTNDRRSRFHLLELAMGGSALAFLHRLGTARNFIENIDDPDYYPCFILLRQWIVVRPWRLGDHCSTRVSLSDTIPYQHQSIHCSI